MRNRRRFRPTIIDLLAQRVAATIFIACLALWLVVAALTS